MAMGPQPRPSSAPIPREAETREETSRAKEWQPAAILPDPNPRDGWTYRWVCTDILGQPIASHVGLMRREGWEPVRAEDYPELMLQASGNVEVGGLMLCRRPADLSASHRKYLDTQNARQIESADNDVMKQDGRTNMRFSKPERDSRVFRS